MTPRQRYYNAIADVQIKIAITHQLVETDGNGVYTQDEALEEAVYELGRALGDIGKAQDALKEMRLNLAKSEPIA